MKPEDIDRRSLELHRLVATKVRRYPALLGRAAEILARWRQTPSLSAPYLDEWQHLIDAGMDACLAVATEESQRANTLRSCSPLSCLLTAEERLIFLADWYGYRGAEAQHWIERVRAAQTGEADLSTQSVEGSLESSDKALSDRGDSPSPKSRELDLELLKRLAARYVWWKTPEEAIARPERIFAQVMNIGDYEDVQALAKMAGDDVLREVLANAEIGQFNERSWHYWHYRLGVVSPGNEVPPLPSRRFV